MEALNDVLAWIATAVLQGQAMITQPTINRRPGFFTLPLEIREEIYGLAIEPNSYVQAFQHDTSIITDKTRLIIVKINGRGSNILQTLCLCSRTLRTEVLAYIFSTWAFRFDLQHVHVSYEPWIYSMESANIAQLRRLRSIIYLSVLTRMGLSLGHVRAVVDLDLQQRQVTHYLSGVSSGGLVRTMTMHERRRARMLELEDFIVHVLAQKAWRILDSAKEMGEVAMSKESFVQIVRLFADLTVREHKVYYGHGW